VAEETAEQAPQVEIAGPSPPRGRDRPLPARSVTGSASPRRRPRGTAPASLPTHAGFFERYERIRYAGETPSEEELRAMEEEVLGG
jgi:hypothetical protein